MKFKIGFTAEKEEKTTPIPSLTPPPKKQEAVQSLVQVKFPSMSKPLTYYNGSFDLKMGDIVYVDGKLEGQRGTVVDIEYNFKIKVHQFQTVVAVVDTEVHGQFYVAGSHFVTFDPLAIPKEKIASWFMAPSNADEIYVVGYDDTSFPLSDIHAFKIGQQIAERGFEYYSENRVCYISIDGTKGYAFVDGSEGYEVEFLYEDGQISHMTCGCPCGYHCKHEFAALLQLRETLDLIETNYAEQYEKSKYFAAISKISLFKYAIDGKKDGSITL